MRKLFFDLQGNGKLFWFTVSDFKIENGFYIFLDIKTQTERRYHESLFRGVEEL